MRLRGDRMRRMTWDQDGDPRSMVPAQWDPWFTRPPMALWFIGAAFAIGIFLRLVDLVRGK